MARRVGLTGGVGSGKSTVAKLFSDRGIPVIDADQIARQVVLPGSEGLSQIIAHFGNQVLMDDGSLDRKALAEIVFADPQQRSWLEALLHPLIQIATDRQAIALEASWCVLEIPLLVETGRHLDMYRTIVVHCPEGLRIERLQRSRKMTVAQIQRVLDSQASDQQRLEIADFVVKNDGDPEQLPDQVDRIIEEINALLK